MILPLEQQVTSLEISKKLKSLGVKQESLFYYTRRAFNAITGESRFELQMLFHNLSSIPDYYISAYTSAELGVLLPVNCDFGIREQNEAEARGKMLILLIENKLIEV